MESKQEQIQYLLDLLKTNHITFQSKEHKEVTSMDEYEEIEKDLHCEMAKNLFLCNRQQTSFYLLLMPKDKKFKTKELSAQIQSARLSFASEEALSSLLHCSMGSTSILGLLFDQENKVKLLIDKDLFSFPLCGIHPCDNRMTLSLNLKELLSFIEKEAHHTYQEVTLFGLE